MVIFGQRIVVMKKFWLLFVLFSSLPLFSQPYANAFLRIGAGADALAMSGAVAARNNEAFSAYWNPAELARQSRSQIGLMHAALYRNMAKWDYVSFVRPVNHQSGAAISLMRLGVDNIMNTTRLIDQNGDVDYNRIRYFSAADYALTISYGRGRIAGKWDGGVNVKILYRHIGDFARAYGFGFDAAVRRQGEKWLLGVVLRDAATTFTHWTVDEKILKEIRDAVPGKNETSPVQDEFTYPQLQAGAARKFNMGKGYGLRVELDLKTDFFKRPALIRLPFASLEPVVGLEGNYKQKIFLRAGVGDIYPFTYFGERIWHFRPSAGTGLRFRYLQLDYAFTGFADKGFFSHIFSLSVDLRLFKKAR